MTMIPLPFPRARAQIRAPTQSHFISLKASLSRKEQAIARLEAEATRLKNKLTSLTNERKLLNEAIETRDPPIKKISPEVLQEIFILCLPVAHNAVMSAREAPLLLCRVCHGWRRLAHATPRLWTSIHIPLCYDNAIVPMPSPDDIISWLSRSKSLPLSISLYGYSPSYLLGVGQLKLYLDGITSVGNRWKSLHLSTDAPDLLEYVFSADVVLGSLEEIHINATSLSNLNAISLSNTGKMIVFDSNLAESLWPKLHSISLPFDALMLYHLNADCKKLTELAISRPDYGTYELSDIAQVLLSAPRLRILAISGFRASYETSAFSHQIIHLPELESLSITNYQPYTYVWGLLGALYTPLLRHWKFYLLPSHDSRPIKEQLNAIYIFLSRLKEPLEELDLHIHSYGTEFRKILSFLPGLKRLSLQRPRASGPFWFGSEGIRNIGDFHLKCFIEGSHVNWESDSDHTAFTGDETEYLPIPPSVFHCPRLEVIKCVCRGRALSEDALVDFLLLRTGSVAQDFQMTPLKRVDIYTESVVSDELQEKVRRILDGTRTLFQLISSPVKPPLATPFEVAYPADESVYNPTF